MELRPRKPAESRGEDSPGDPGPAPGPSKSRRSPLFVPDDSDEEDRSPPPTPGKLLLPTSDTVDLILPELEALNRAPPAGGRFLAGANDGSSEFKSE